MAGHFARKIKNLEHRRALADDSVEFQVFQELLFEGFYASALVVERGDVVESALEATAVHGLRQEVERAPPDCLERRVERVFRSHDDHMEVWIAAQRAIEEVVSVDSRGVNIG